MKTLKRMDNNEGRETTNSMKKLEEIGTQTNSVYPYDCLLLGILDQKEQLSEQKTVQHNSESRVSPTSMLDRYVDICARTSSFSSDNNKARRYCIYDISCKREIIFQYKNIFYYFFFF